MNQGSADAIQSVIDGVDEIAHQMEMRWGVGRLERLVSDELRAKFRRQLDLLNDAIHRQDLERVQQAGAAMIRAWQALDRAATETGQKLLVPEVWEGMLPSSGQVVAIVRTSVEATALQREGRALTVYTLEDILWLLETMPTVQRTMSVFPGAQVVRVKPKGFNEWIGDEMPDFDA